MVSALADWIASPAGIAALIGWTVLAAAALFWLAARLPGANAAQHDDIVWRVFRNSMIPIVSQIMVRVVDLLVAIALLRLLGPTGNGQYALAVVVWLYVKTISDFGLSLLATREVARDASLVGRIVGETTVFRWLVLLGTALPVALYVGLSTASGSMAHASALAIVILYLSIVPSSYAEAINAALNGLERMQLAAIINIGVSLIRAPLAVALGASALGVPGVALAALITSAFTAIAFHRALGSVSDTTITWWTSLGRLRFYLRESWPLLVNALLVSLFFRVDVFIISAFRGDAALGIYDAAYKLINLMTIIPAYATLAVFPLLTRRAGDPAALERAQRTTTYSLVLVAWIIVVILSALSEPAIRILAGADYLPEAALLLRILIWFAPLSFINGVFQYVLVAVNEQRKLVPAFIAAVVFNFGANLVLVPMWGARASAAITIATEVVILTALLVMIRQAHIRIDIRRTLTRTWRPTVAGGVAAASALMLRDQPILALVVASIIFIVLALVTRVVDQEEKELIRRIIARGSAVSS